MQAQEPGLQDFGELSLVPTWLRKESRMRLHTRRAVAPWPWHLTGESAVADPSPVPGGTHSRCARTCPMTQPQHSVL